MLATLPESGLLLLVFPIIATFLVRGMRQLQQHFDDGILAYISAVFARDKPQISQFIGPTISVL
jgi:hypothetical protein